MAKQHGSNCLLNPSCFPAGPLKNCRKSGQSGSSDVAALRSPAHLGAIGTTTELRRADLDLGIWVCAQDSLGITGTRPPSSPRECHRVFLWCQTAQQTELH